MAIARQITVEIGSRSEEQGGERHVRLSVTYDLERQDPDIPVFAARVGAELELAQYRIWQAMDGQQEMPPKDVPDSTQTAGKNGSGNGTMHQGSGDNGSQAASAEPVPQAATLATSPQKIALRSLASRARRTETDLNHLAIQRFGKRTINELTKQEASTLMQALQQGDWGLPQTAHA